MSRTDKDITANVHRLITGHSWCGYYGMGDCPPEEYVAPKSPSYSRTRHEFVRHYWHSERFKVRMALRRGETPEPSRPRRSVAWELDW